MRRRWSPLKTASARPARPMLVQATAVRHLVEVSSLLTVALVLRERRVPARVIARRMGAQPMCQPIVVPVLRARPVRVLGTVGADDDRGSLIICQQAITPAKNTTDAGTASTPWRRQHLSSQPPRLWQPSSSKSSNVSFASGQPQLKPERQRSPDLFE